MTKADKEGAILIINYTEVEDFITKEILNNSKFKDVQQTNAVDHIITDVQKDSK